MYESGINNIDSKNERSSTLAYWEIISEEKKLLAVGVVASLILISVSIYLAYSSTAASNGILDHNWSYRPSLDSNINLSINGVNGQVSLSAMDNGLALYQERMQNLVEAIENLIEKQVKDGYVWPSDIWAVDKNYFFRLSYNTPLTGTPGFPTQLQIEELRSAYNNCFKYLNDGYIDSRKIADLQALNSVIKEIRKLPQFSENIHGLPSYPERVENTVKAIEKLIALQNKEGRIFPYDWSDIDQRFIDLFNDPHIGTPGYPTHDQISNLMHDFQNQLHLDLNNYPHHRGWFFDPQEMEAFTEQLRRFLK